MTQLYHTQFIHTYFKTSSRHLERQTLNFKKQLSDPSSFFLARTTRTSAGRPNIDYVPTEWLVRRNDKNKAVGIASALDVS